MASHAHSSRGFRALAALTVAFASGAAAAASEVNPNAHFDLDVAGVTLGNAPVGAVMTWTPEDLTGRIGSGALRLSGPAGAYTLSGCVHPEQFVANPYAPVRFEFTARMRSPDLPAVVDGRVELMFGGDDPATDGPCIRPTIAQFSAQGVAAPDASLAASRVEGAAWPDAWLTLVIHKGPADVLVDAWSLTVESVPLLGDGFE